MKRYRVYGRTRMNKIKENWKWFLKYSNRNKTVLKNFMHENYNYSYIDFKLAEQLDCFFRVFFTCQILLIQRKIAMLTKEKTFSIVYVTVMKNNLIVMLSVKCIVKLVNY